MRTKLFAGVAAAALMIPAAASAQETTSSIRGNVVSAGTAVSGATVTITDTATGQRTTATTDAAGSFNASGLRPGGPYTVEVQSASGNLSVTDIYTVVGQPYDVPIDLASGATDEGTEIVVTASSLSGAGTNSSGPQTLLRREEIAAVATVNRDIRDLMRRDPFARIEDTASGGRSVSFAGVNPRFNRFSIDGVVVSDNFGLNPDANPTRRGPVPIDSIAQFAVSVAPVDIRQGNFLGGAVDAVLLQGTNEFHGSGFYSLNNDSLSGTRIGSTTIPLDYKSETYGATISGPIIKDKLFFMLSAERNTQGNPLQPFSTIPGASTATADQVASIAQSVYGYDAGGILSISQEKDEKIVGKLTWNVSDGQRLSLTYINAYDTIDVLGNVSTNINTPGFGLESNSYSNTELLRAGILQLNSEWSDNFSTEARFLYKSYERGRLPGGEGGFAQFRVCGDATNNSAVGSPAGTTNDQPVTCGTNNPIYGLGVENSTQANQFYTDTYGGSIQARWNYGAHDLRLLAEMNEVRIFNVFLQNTLGAYYFDSLADFQNRLASQVTYQNTATGDQNLAAADFKYRQYTFGIQDDIAVTDRLNVNVGLRYDLFDADTPVPFNAGFTSRYGFPNTRTIKGKGLFQPRIGANWEPIDDVKLRGGVGVYGGGTPDVYLSNSYSNAGAGVGGVAINSVTVQRCAISSSCTTGYQINGANVAAATALPLLSNVSGTSIPAGLQAQIPNTGANGLANINALDPDFEIPNVWKATLSADWTPRFLGGGWRFGADYYFSRTNASVFFTDLRSIPIGTLPDGRTRFGPLVGTNTNTDILLTNSSKGRSHIGVVRVSKDFDFGLNLNFAYSQQDVKDQAPATSSTAGSNYGNGAFIDGRGAAYGTANDQVAWSFKYGVGFNHAFFDDYKTIIQLFGETQAGRPFSYTMADLGSATRSAVFGVTGRDDRFLLYVPSGPSDPIVSYDTAATQAALEDLISRTNLKDYRGKIAPRNSARSRAYTRLDLHLEQEFPTFVGKSRVSVFADIENLPNLINKDWGGFRQALFPYVEDAVQVQCLSAPTATGTAPAAANINSSSAQPCAQYRYSSYVEPNPSTLEVRRSLYLIRVGARFSF